MPNPHWPPTTLITKLRQRCNTLRRSMATCLAISWWALQQAPRMHYFTVWGEGWCFREADVGCHLCSIFLFFFFQLPSAFSVSYFLSLTFYPLNIPPGLFELPLLSLYLYISVCLCLSLPLCLVLFFSSFAALLTPPSSPPVKFAKDFLILSISISSFSPQLLGREECIVLSGTPFVTLLIYF